MSLAVDLRETAGDIEFGARSAGPERVAVDAGTAIVESARRTGKFMTSSVTGIFEILSGSRRLDDLAGPVRIAEVSGETFVELGFGALAVLTAVLSVNIGIVNLLPIPVLDGGHLVFLAVEACRRRPLSPRVLKFCSLGGLLAILAIFVLITSNDLARLGIFG
jgi:regulator of sigma E protease